MNSRVRDILLLVIGLAVVLGVAAGGYAAVRARAQGSGTSQSLAPVPKPTPAPTSAPEPQYDRWTVGKAVATRDRVPQPSMSAPVKVRARKGQRRTTTRRSCCRQDKEVDGRVWYKVWLAMRPNESRGWIPEGRLAFFTTTAKIIIDLSERRLACTDAARSSTRIRWPSAGRV